MIAFKNELNFIYYRKKIDIESDFTKMDACKANNTSGLQIIKNQHHIFSQAYVKFITLFVIFGQPKYLNSNNIAHNLNEWK